MTFFLQSKEPNAEGGVWFLNAAHAVILRIQQDHVRKYAGGAFGEMKTMSGKDDRDSHTIPPAVAQQIDENLKRLYSDAVSEDLPSSLTDLLNALREKDAQKKSGDK